MFEILHLSLICKYTTFETSWLCNSSKAGNSSNQMLLAESNKSFILTSVTLLTFPCYHVMAPELCTPQLPDKHNLHQTLSIKLHKQLQMQHNKLILTTAPLLSLLQNCICNSIFVTIKNIVT